MLAQIYDLCQKEEEYESGDIGSWNELFRTIPLSFTNLFTDGDDVYYWPAEKSVSRKKNQRSWDLLVNDSGTDSYADSAPPFKRSKKNSSASTPAGSPVIAQQRGVHRDDSMQDCKPAPNTGFTSRRYAAKSAAPSSQGSWGHHASVEDSKNPRLIHPMQSQIQVVQDSSCMPREYTQCSPWANASSSAPFSEPERQAISQAFAMDMSTSTLPGRHFQHPHHSFGHAQSQACPAYMAAQIPHSQFEDVSVTGLYTPPIMSHAPLTNEQIQHNPYLNGVYYCQPSGAQHFATTSPALQPYVPRPEQCYTVDPATFQHPEPGQSPEQHPSFRHGGSDFQAPARVERGFTGHGSGVGGGAHT